MTVAKNNIKVDIRERIYSFIEKIDHSFGLENYHYVLENINDDLVKDVYRKLGPFDHF
jgi:predicted methyltransferase